jgi:Na+/proline symporter
MSTADSFVNIGSAALVRDLPRAFGGSVGNELAWGRAAVLLIGGLAAIIAYLWGDLIALLGTFAFGTFGAALVPALAVGLNWKRVTARAASASIATGLVLNLVLEFLDQQRWFPELPGPPLAAGVLPAAASLAASFAVLFLVTAVTSEKGETEDASSGTHDAVSRSRVPDTEAILD